MAADGAKEQWFDEIVSANRRRIIAIARSYARGDECWDLYQDILLQMWKGLDGFAGRSAPSTWVYRVALNTAITFRRRNGRRVDASGTLMDSDTGPIAPPSPGNEVLILKEFLHSLGKVDRAVFLLYLEDFSYREISEVIGLTENHVGVRINRLKKAFTLRYCGG